jgi:ribonuclease BN (tRNA processing enzyme)
LRSRLARYLSNPLSPVDIRELPAHVEFRDVPVDGWRCGELEVQASLIAHRGPTLGYRISDGDTTVAYLPDHEPALGTALGSAAGEWISGLGLSRGATVLIHDAQYSASEYVMRRGWGHSSINDAVTFAKRSEPETLFLFHHDPGHDDRSLQSLAEQAADAAASVGLDGRVELAREGVTFEL